MLENRSEGKGLEERLGGGEQVEDGQRAGRRHKETASLERRDGKVTTQPDDSFMVTTRKNVSSVKHISGKSLKSQNLENFLPTGLEPKKTN